MITYSQFTRNRKPEFKLITSFEEIDNSKYVSKKAANKSAQEFLESFTNKFELLSENQMPFMPVKPTLKDKKVYFDFIEGETLSYKVESAITEGNEDKAVEIVNDYIKKINELCSNATPKKDKAIEFFGSGVAACENWTQHGIIDLDLGNVIQNRDKYYLIDYEWIFDFPVPCDYIIFRALTGLVVHSFGGKNIYSDKLLELYKTYIREEFIEAEYRFQSYVVDIEIPHKQFLDSYKDFKYSTYKPMEYINDKYNVIRAKDEKIQQKEVEINYLREKLDTLLSSRPIKVALKVSNQANKIRKLTKKIK